MALTKKHSDEIKKLVESYPTKRALVLPALWVVQDADNWVSNDAMEGIAEQLGLSAAYVRGVATFYTMYNKKEVGKYFVQVCTNVPCQLLGAETTFNYLSKKLGIKVGETTPDKKFSLLEVECLASCGTAPMMQINEEYYENLTEKKIDEILKSLE